MKSAITTAVVVAVAMLTLAPATAAAADSIYLKNGRVIRVDDARVDGDRVIFFLHGAHQAIPLALVDRVEDDDWRGPGAPLRSPDPSVLVTESDADVDTSADAATPVQAILPALTRLGAALFAPEYSAAATDAAARELLQGLSKLGVSDADIRAKARQFGIPEDILDRIGRR